MASPLQTTTPGSRVLLLEDNHINRQLMTDFLVAQGFSVLSLPSAITVLSALKEFRPQIILLDLKLPEIDGYTVLELLKAHPTWQTVPIIVVSAFAFCADRDRALRLGANRYLTKPVKLPELIQAIHEEVLYSCV